MDYHSLPRKQLQALCKKHGIPANAANSEMADALTALLKPKPQLHAGNSKQPEKRVTRSRETALSETVSKSNNVEEGLSTRLQKDNSSHKILKEDSNKKPQRVTRGRGSASAVSEVPKSSALKTAKMPTDGDTETKCVTEQQETKKVRTRNGGSKQDNSEMPPNTEENKDAKTMSPSEKKKEKAGGIVLRRGKVKVRSPRNLSKSPESAPVTEEVERTLKEKAFGMPCSQSCLVDAKKTKKKKRSVTFSDVLEINSAPIEHYSGDFASESAKEPAKEMMVESQQGVDSNLPRNINAVCMAKKVIGTRKASRSVSTDVVAAQSDHQTSRKELSTKVSKAKGQHTIDTGKTASIEIGGEFDKTRAGGGKKTLNSLDDAAANENEEEKVVDGFVKSDHIEAIPCTRRSRRLTIVPTDVKCNHDMQLATEHLQGQDHREGISVAPQKTEGDLSEESSRRSRRKSLAPLELNHVQSTLGIANEQMEKTEGDLSVETSRRNRRKSLAPLELNHVQSTLGSANEQIKKKVPKAKVTQKKTVMSELKGEARKSQQKHSEMKTCDRKTKEPNSSEANVQVIKRKEALAARKLRGSRQKTFMTSAHQQTMSAEEVSNEIDSQNLCSTENISGKLNETGEKSQSDKFHSKVALSSNILANSEPDSLQQFSSDANTEVETLKSPLTMPESIGKGSKVLTQPDYGIAFSQAFSAQTNSVEQEGLVTVDEAVAKNIQHSEDLGVIAQVHHEKGQENKNTNLPNVENINHSDNFSCELQVVIGEGGKGQHQISEDGNSTSHNEEFEYNACSIDVRTSCMIDIPCAAGDSDTSNSSPFVDTESIKPDTAAAVRDQEFAEETSCATSPECVLSGHGFSQDVIEQGVHARDESATIVSSTNSSPFVDTELIKPDAAAAVRDQEFAEETSCASPECVLSGHEFSQDVIEQGGDARDESASIISSTKDTEDKSWSNLPVSKMIQDNGIQDGNHHTNAVNSKNSIEIDTNKHITMAAIAELNFEDKISLDTATAEHKACPLEVHFLASDKDGTANRISGVAAHLIEQQPNQAADLNVCEEENAVDEVEVKIHGDLNGIQDGNYHTNAIDLKNSIEIHTDKDITAAPIAESKHKDQISIDTAIAELHACPLEVHLLTSDKDQTANRTTVIAADSVEQQPKPNQTEDEDAVDKVEIKIHGDLHGDHHTSAVDLKNSTEIHTDKDITAAAIAGSNFEDQISIDIATAEPKACTLEVHLPTSDKVVACLVEQQPNRAADLNLCEEEDAVHKVEMEITGDLQKEQLQDTTEGVSSDAVKSVSDNNIANAQLGILSPILPSNSVEMGAAAPRDSVHEMKQRCPRSIYKSARNLVSWENTSLEENATPHSNEEASLNSSDQVEEDEEIWSLNIHEMTGDELDSASSEDEESSADTEETLSETEMCNFNTEMLNSNTGDYSSSEDETPSESEKDTMFDSEDYFSEMEEELLSGEECYESEEQETSEEELSESEDDSGDELEEYEVSPVSQSVTLLANFDALHITHGLEDQTVKMTAASSLPNDGFLEAEIINHLAIDGCASVVEPRDVDEKVGGQHEELKKTLSMHAVTETQENVDERKTSNDNAAIERAESATDYNQQDIEALGSQSSLFSSTSLYVKEDVICSVTPLGILESNVSQQFGPLETEPSILLESGREKSIQLCFPCDLSHEEVIAQVGQHTMDGAKHETELGVSVGGLEKELEMDGQMVELVQDREKLLSTLSMHAAVEIQENDALASQSSIFSSPPSYVKEDVLSSLTSVGILESNVSQQSGPLETEPNILPESRQEKSIQLCFPCELSHEEVIAEVGQHTMDRAKHETELCVAVGGVEKELEMDGQMVELVQDREDLQSTLSMHAAIEIQENVDVMMPHNDNTAMEQVQSTISSAYHDSGLLTSLSSLFASPPSKVQEAATCSMYAAMENQENVDVLMSSNDITAMEQDSGLLTCLSSLFASPPLRVQEDVLMSYNDITTMEQDSGSLTYLSSLFASPPSGVQEDANCSFAPSSIGIFQSDVVQQSKALETELNILPKTEQEESIQVCSPCELPHKNVTVDAEQHEMDGAKYETDLCESEDGVEEELESKGLMVELIQKNFVENSIAEAAVVESDVSQQSEVETELNILPKSGQEENIQLFFPCELSHKNVTDEVEQHEIDGVKHENDLCESEGGVEEELESNGKMVELIQDYFAKSSIPGAAVVDHLIPSPMLDDAEESQLLESHNETEQIHSTESESRCLGPPEPILENIGAATGDPVICEEVIQNLNDTHDLQEEPGNSRSNENLSYGIKKDEANVQVKNDVDNNEGSLGMAPDAQNGSKDLGELLDLGEGNTTLGLTEELMITELATSFGSSTLAMNDESYELEKEDKENAVADNLLPEISKEESMKQIDLTLNSVRELRQMCKTKLMSAKKKKTENETPAKTPSKLWTSATKQVVQPNTSMHPRDVPSATKRSALKALSSNIKATPSAATQTPTAKGSQRPQNLMTIYDGSDGTGKHLVTPSPKAPMSSKRDFARSHHR